MKGIMQGMHVNFSSILGAIAATPKWPSTSVMISRPVQDDIGFPTKSPGLSTDRP
jgi:hypothetical protein